MKYRLIYGLVGLILLPTLGLVWLLNSESGLRWGYQQVMPYLPDSLTVTGLSGTLTGPLTVGAVSYHDQGQTLDARQVMLTWNPWSLLRSNVDISEFRIDSLDIVLPEDNDTNTADSQPLSLPQIKLPLGINLNRAVINAISITRGTDSYRIEQIKATASIGVGGFVIENFEIDSEALKLSLQGRLHPTADYVHDFKLSWQAFLPSGENIEATGAIRGDLRSTHINQSVQGALQMELSLELHELLGQPSWQSELEVSAIDDNLLNFKLPFSLDRLKLVASGDTEAAQVSGSMSAESAELGVFDADFELSSLTGERMFEGIHIDALKIGAPQGQLSASGQFDWAPALRWEADISASQLNPVTLLPQWPGNIEAQLSSSGAIEDGELIASANISRMQGELRGYPVSLRSQLQLKNNTVEIAQLDFSSGNTRLKLEGLLNETLDLRWSLDSDNLAELYPQAQGELKASGGLEGSRQSPRLKAAFDGNTLQFLEYEVGSIQGDLELDVLNPEQFRLSFASQQLRLQGQALQSLDIVADPNRIQANIVAAEASAMIVLDGKIANHQWQGKLMQAEIQTRDYDNWTLQKPSTLSLSASSQLVDSVCLRSDRGGRICNRITGKDDTWEIGVEASDIALSMIGRWLPPELKIEGTVSASADLEFRLPQQLLGNIELDLPQGVASYRLSDSHTERIDYRSARFGVQLEATGISADTTLELTNGDGFKGHIVLPGASLLSVDPESQTMQASVRLDARELGVLDLMVEEIDGIQGAITLDVKATGTLGNPRVKGSAKLLDGDINIPGLNLRLSQMNLYLSSEDYEKISYRGEAQTSGGTLTLSGDTLLQADNRWPSNLQIEADGLNLAVLLKPWLPEDTKVNGMLFSSARLKFRAPDELYGEIELSMPSGNLSYPLLEGELENWEYRNSSLKLALNQQGIRGQSTISIGDGNTLLGDIHLPDARVLALNLDRQIFEAKATLSIIELALIEALVPEIDNLQGSLDLQLSADGTMAQPAMVANAEMLDASASIPRLGLTLERINLHGATIAENKFKFKLDVASGDGSLTVAGISHLDAASGWPTTLSIKGQEFEVSSTSEATVQVSPDLVVELQNRNIDIRGDLLVPYARLRPRDVTQAAQVSSDTVVIGSTAEAQPRWRITNHINLILGDRVNFSGYDFDGQLGGKLLIEESEGQLTRGIGEINIPKGRYSAYGQRLDIENGRLLFIGGPLTNPGLDIRAVRKTDSVTAGIHVTGLLKQPQLSLFSTPVMDQADTLSYLLLGRPLEGSTDKDGAMMAKAALALKLTGGDKIARNVGDRLGLDEMHLEGSDSGDQASLVVGRYLSPKLYVSYGIGLIESFNTLNLRYNVTEQWLLKAESGESQGADLMYTFER